MKIVLKMVVALIALFFLLMWLRWMVEPAAMATEWALSATDAAGTNNLRGDIGGLFLSAAVFCGLWLLRGNAVWLKAAAVAMCCVIVGRITGFLVDGVNQASLVATVLEVIFVTVFLAAAGASQKP
jgi:Domain of unknown function (DUF4345)